MRVVAESIEDYSITHGYAAYLGISGVALLAQGRVIDAGYASEALGLLAVTAAALILTGLQWRGNRLMRPHIEKIGHIFAVATWLMEIVVQYQMTHAIAYDMAGALIFAAMSAVKARTLHRQARSDERLVRNKVKQMREGA